MAFPQHHFQHHPLQPQPQQPPLPTKAFRDIYNTTTTTTTTNMMDGRISPPGTYFNGPDQPQHPPYIPPFHVAGLVPGPVDEGGLGLDLLQWNNTAATANDNNINNSNIDNHEEQNMMLKKKRPKEQDFLLLDNNNNSQMSSVDFWNQQQARSISTGLGLSLDNNRLASSGDSGFLGLVGDDIDQELQRQEAEINRYLKLQGDRLRQAVLEKVQASQMQTVSYVEEKVLQKLREKEAEVEDINRKNIELEMQMEQLALEANAWQQRAKYNENMISTLKFNLQQVYAQSRDSKEGCGDSEVDDTASCCNGRAIDFHLLCKDGNAMKELMTCKVCRVNEVRMLLLPCKHLCLCKECESKLSMCPLCQSSKYIGMEVYM